MLKAAWTCDIGKWGGTGVVNADDDSHITAYKFHFSCLLPAHPSPLELCTPAAVFRVKCMDFGFSVSTLVSRVLVCLKHPFPHL